MTPDEPAYPSIPYGLANFRRIRMERRLYVDKTRFLRALERVDHAVLIRPRRFGKTCWVSVLEHYYDRTWAHEFDAVFGGTDIGREPTEQRHRYVVLRFNFSAFKNALDGLEHHFEEYCQLRLRGALERNPDLFPEAAVRRIRAPASVNGQLNELFMYAADHGIPLCALVDEYDNFANTVLAHHGEAAYRSFTHGGGFYRNFFATLKAGTDAGSGGLERLFITGVSPVTLDDVTSGFNIGRNISLRPEFNDLLGFTEEEVRGLLEVYRDCGVFDQDVDAALDVMREWYNGYRFAEDVEGDLYNTDMVLYYLCESIPNGSIPDELIDTNVRVDYGKLRRLLLARGAPSRPPADGSRVVDGHLNGNFELLRHVIGEGQVDAQVQPSLPLERLNERENFLSLLHFFGLLSFRHASADTPRLGIPNQTVRRLMYGYLRDAWRDVDVFSVDAYDFSRLVRAMAYEGAWRPALEHLRDAVRRQTGIRDYVDGEKVVHAFLAAHFSLLDVFLIHTEHELNKGYADLYLEPFAARYPGVAFGYMIEVKYLKRRETLHESAVAEKMREAADQVRRYLADEGLRRRHPSVRHVGLAVVFHGWEMAACEAVGADPAAEGSRSVDG